MISSHQIHPRTMTPPTLERLLYTVRKEGRTGEQAVQELIGDNVMYFMPGNLSRLLSDKECQFIRWVSESRKIPYNRLFAVAYDQPLEVGVWRKDYLNSFGEHDSSGAMFNSLEDWLEAERVGWAAYPNKTGGWKNQCETVDPTYFVPMILHRHVPRKDVALVLEIRDTEDGSPGEIIERFFHDPMAIAQARHIYAERLAKSKSPRFRKPALPPLQPTATELETEVVRLRLDVKLVRLLQAFADYQGVSLDEVAKTLVVRGAMLVAGAPSDAEST